jgi:prepilin-type N-terminal cleavage/methylation domain-containing protein
MHLSRSFSRSDFRKNPANVRGFTVIELIVVLAIMAALLTVAVPLVWGHLRSSSLKNAAFKISSDLSLARSTAIRNRTNCSINFNTPAPDQYTTTLLNKTVDLDSYMGGVIFTANPDGGTDVFSPTVTFNVRGLSASSQVYLTNQDNTFIYRVQVSAAGGVSLHRWDAGLSGAGGWQ